MRLLTIKEKACLAYIRFSMRHIFYGIFTPPAGLDHLRCSLLVECNKWLGSRMTKAKLPFRLHDARKLVKSSVDKDFIRVREAFSSLIAEDFDGWSSQEVLRFMRDDEERFWREAELRLPSQLSLR